MIENERHPSWVSFVTIFLPVFQTNRLYRQAEQPAAAHSLSAWADNVHVCKPRGVFSDVHAAGKNRSNPFRACGRELCEAFSIS